MANGPTPPEDKKPTMTGYLLLALWVVVIGVIIALLTGPVAIFAVPFILVVCVATYFWSKSREKPES